MAKSRSKTALVKAIEKSDCPIYLIDGDQRLAYGNDAFFQWIGRRIAPKPDETTAIDGASDLIGARLVYSTSSSLSPSQRRLSGLAPPPALAAGNRPFTAEVSCHANDNAPEFISANFSFVDVPPDQRYLLAVVSKSHIDQSSTTALLNRDRGAPEQLHAALIKLATSLQSWHRCSALIGDSPYVTRLQKQVKAAAQHSHEFTIRGPSGSGREQLARLIMQQRISTSHGGSDEFQLVTLHGYVADAELVQSCVAQATRLTTQAALETSHRTDKTHTWMLILDADVLDAAAQAELWSSLQSPSSRLRIFATSQRDLIQCVKTEGFHPGLAHLLTTQTIETIPLRNHLSDLALLIQYEIENCNVDRSTQLNGLSTAALGMLKQYHWPGDLSELAAIIDSAARNCNGSEINVGDFPEKFQFAIAALKSPPKEVIEIDLEKYLEKIELELVARALRMAKGNKTKASKLLGVSRAKLLRRIQHFDLQHPIAATSELDPLDLSADDFRPLDEPLFEEADE